MNFHALRYVCVILILAIAALPGQGAALKAIEAFQEGNDAYNATNYDRAVRMYHKAAEMNFRPAALYYNLGNSYYRLGKLGNAIADYRRARLLQPRDADSKENLAIARSQAEDGLKIQTLPDTVKSFLFLYYYIGFDELIWLCAAVSALFFLLAILYLFVRRRLLKSLLVVLACVTLLLAATAGLHCYNRFLRHDAVVIADQAPVHSGPMDSYPDIFILHDGSEARVLERQDAWVKIQVVIADEKKRGWINQADIVIL